eukprot:Cvel_21524.t1-p1 / transcript=Cvel_21524.t1 / gene=Cvel_21524 / organism=Chromera_velia_CCMP2878 / gene_product=hypothetical protein / transcript_product=hypothetical protein / location=Cvel_scaffold2026:34160-34785(+) / protein_length=107 / sequence_SO=supercontig / SO=protein_coding / is_pseudo=false
MPPQRVNPVQQCDPECFEAIIRIVQSVDKGVFSGTDRDGVCCWHHLIELGSSVKLHLLSLRVRADAQVHKKKDGHSWELQDILMNRCVKKQNAQNHKTRAPTRFDLS